MKESKKHLYAPHASAARQGSVKEIYTVMDVYCLSALGLQIAIHHLLYYDWCNMKLQTMLFFELKTPLERAPQSTFGLSDVLKP